MLLEGGRASTNTWHLLSESLQSSHRNSDVAGPCREGKWCERRSRMYHWGSRSLRAGTHRPKALNGCEPGDGVNTPRKERCQEQ